MLNWKRIGYNFCVGIYVGITAFVFETLKKKWYFKIFDKFIIRNKPNVRPFSNSKTVASLSKNWCKHLYKMCHHPVLSDSEIFFYFNFCFYLLPKSQYFQWRNETSTISDLFQFDDCVLCQQLHSQTQANVSKRIWLNCMSIR